MLETLLWWMPSVGNLGFLGVCDVAEKTLLKVKLWRKEGLDFLIVIIFIL